MQRLHTICRETLVPLTEAGRTTSELAAHFGCAPCTIRRRAKELGLTLNREPHHRTRTYHLNDKWFSSLNPHKAYMLGFIAADGGIERNWGLKIKIKSRDRVLLDRLKQDVEFDGPITDTEADTVSLRLYSVDLVADLANYGVVPAKTKSLEFAHNVPPQLVIDYMRGVMDGDGSIGRQARLVTGSKPFNDGFLAWYRLTYSTTPWNRQEDNKFRIVFNRRDKQFIKDMYGHGFSLPRKLQRCHLHEWLS